MSWTKLTNGLPASLDMGRISLTMCSSNPNTLYAGIANTGANGFGLLGVYKTTDGGTSWSQVSNNPNFYGVQGWYNNVIAVDPVNPDIVYSGGVGLYKSTDGGVTWNILAGIHVDQHAIEFHPNDPNTIFVGNDGGVYKSTDGGSSWSSLNNGLVTFQFYKMGSDPNNANIAFGGTQDNGTNRYNNSANWTQVLGGDGMEVIVDHNNSNIVYAEIQYGNHFKSTDGGNSWTGVNNGLPSSGPWVTPVEMDPMNPLILYTIANLNLYRTTDGASNWSLLFDATQSLQYDIRVAPSDNQTIYVAGYSSIYRTTDGGSSWTDISSGLTFSSIAVHPSQPLTVYVTILGWSDGTHIFKSTNGGLNWINVTNNLPNIPCNSLVIDPLSPDHLYLGTDLGVYFSSDAGASWTEWNDGLANVVIDELDIQQSYRKIRAATHGRGMYEADLVFTALNPEIAVSPTSFTFNVPSGGSASDILTISNTAPPGALDLIWDIFDKEVAQNIVDDRKLPIGRKNPQPKFDVLFPSNSLEINSSLPITQIEHIGKIHTQSNNIESRGVIFRDDFEDGDYDGWVNMGTGTKEVTSATAADGTVYSYHEYNSPAGAFNGIMQNIGQQQPGYISLYIRSGSTSESDALFIAASSTPGTALGIGAGGGGFLIGPGGLLGPPYIANTWYHVEFRDIDWINGTFDFYLDGSLIQSGLSLEGNTDLQRLYLYNFDEGSEAWWDEIYLSTEADCPWLTENPTSGTIPAGGSQNVNIMVDATGLSAGTYGCELEINSNADTVTVPVTLNVYVLDSSLVTWCEEPGPITGITGTQDTVFICVDDVTGLNVISYQSTITFDNTVLNCVGATSVGTITGPWGTPTTNCTVPGQISVGGFGTALLSGSGALVGLIFDVVGAQGATTNVCIQDMLFNAGNPIANIPNPCIPYEVLNEFNISGIVTYCPNGNPVPNTNLILSGAISDTQTTDVSGNYAFPDITAGMNYTVTPEKIGDVEPLSDISCYDAALTAQIAVGLLTADHCDSIEADVDEDGNILTFDAALICRYAVGLPPFGSTDHTAEWRFEPPSRSYTQLNSNQLNQNYTAALLGDVDDNWAPTAPQPMLARGEAYEPLSQLSAGQGEILSIPFVVEAGQKVISADIDFRYNPDIMEFVEVNRTNLSQGFEMVVNAEEGRVRIGAFSTEAVTEEGVFLLLKFRITGKEKEEGKLTLANYQLNGITIKQDEVNFVIGQSSLPTKFALHQNYPNPFNPETIIRFDIPMMKQKTIPVHLAIYNIAGQLVRTVIDDPRAPGSHEVIWNGRDDNGRRVASGVYVYSLAAGDFFTTRKMIFLK